MKCRFDIIGRKVWTDNDNAFSTRPEYVDITLYRDEVAVKTVRINSSSDGEYRFPCLIIWKNQSEKYFYRVDEDEIPDGYLKRIDGYNVVNTLENIQVEGTKTWEDNNNIGGLRPADITVRLLRNGVEIDSTTVISPTAPINTVDFDFGLLPFADSNGVPYIYSVIEDPVDEYVATYDGLNITNTLGIIP